MGVRRYARERWRRQFAKDFIVVHAEHRDLLGHGEASAAAGVEYLLTTRIVAGEDGCGQRESSEPARDRVGLRVAGTIGSRRGRIALAGVSRLARQLRELLTPR